MSTSEVGDLFFDTFVAVTFLRSRPKVIFSFHGMSYEEYNIRKRFSDALRRKLLNRVDQNMTLNESMRKMLAKRYHFQETAIKIIGNGLDASIFTPHISDRTVLHELKTSLHLHEDDFILGTVGRLDRIKNIGFLIKSCLILRQQIPNIKLLIVGDGEEFATLFRMTKELNLQKYIIFTGKQENIHNIYPLMDTYVQSSLYEGFSNTILEAMASGRPIVSSDVGGNPDLVIHGENGYLFESNNSDEFITYILRLYENAELRHHFAHKSRQLVEEKWTIDVMVNNYETMYSAMYESKS